MNDLQGTNVYYEKTKEYEMMRHQLLQYRQFRMGTFIFSMTAFSSVLSYTIGSNIFSNNKIEVWLFLLMSMITPMLILSAGCWLTLVLSQRIKSTCEMLSIFLEKRCGFESEQVLHNYKEMIKNNKKRYIRISQRKTFAQIFRFAGLFPFIIIFKSFSDLKLIGLWICFLLLIFGAIYYLGVGFPCRCLLRLKQEEIHNLMIKANPRP